MNTKKVYNKYKNAKIFIMMTDTSILLRTLSTTSSHVEQQTIYTTFVDPSTGLDTSILDGGTTFTAYDTLHVDTSILDNMNGMRRHEIGYRSDTHLDVSYGDVSTLAPIANTKNIWDLQLEQLKTQIDYAKAGQSPYKDYYDTINKIVKKNLGE